MVGPIHGERKVSWASTSVSALGSPTSTHMSRKGSRVQELASGSESQHYFFSPGEERSGDNSPLPMTSGTVSRDQPYLATRHVRQHTSTEPFLEVSPASSLATETAKSEDPSSAPATMQGGMGHAAFSAMPTSGSMPSEQLPPVALVLAAAEAARPAEAFELDATAPMQRAKHKSAPGAPDAPRSHQAHPATAAEAVAEATANKRFTAPPGQAGAGSLLELEDSDHGQDDDGVVHHDTLELERRASLQASSGESSLPHASGSEAQDAPAVGSSSARARGGDGTDLWGQSFKVEWVRTERLSFYRTRHIRNPWNQDREVKVSRDGTELEPTIGQQLLDVWDMLEPSPPPRSPVVERRGPRRPVPPKSAPPSAQVVQMARGLPFERIADLP
jgi:hypothetical protein